MYKNSLINRFLHFFWTDSISDTTSQIIMIILLNFIFLFF